MLDGMLFHGPLPLTKLGFTAVDAFVTQYYTELVFTAFYYGWFDVYCLQNVSNTFLISFPLKNSNLSSMLED